MKRLSILFTSILCLTLSATCSGAELSIQGRGFTKRDERKSDAQAFLRLRYENQIVSQKKLEEFLLNKFLRKEVKEFRKWLNVKNKNS